MYKKNNSIPLKNGVSMVPNNLAILNDYENKISTFAVIHKSIVNCVRELIEHHSFLMLLFFNTNNIGWYLIYLLDF